MSKSNVYAFIPARGGSKGIPRKNLADLAGKPLVAHTILQAKASQTIDHVFVNSEDAEIRQVAAQYGAETISRPEEFFYDNSVQEVDRLLKWTILELEKTGHKVDVGVLLYSTSPLREVHTIDQAVELVIADGYDSVLSLFSDTTYLWKQEGNSVVPTNYDPKTRGPRQKENWNQWGENKAVYVFRRDLLVETGCRLGGRVGFVEMPKWRSVDVDSPEDLELVRKLYETRSVS